MLLCGINSYLTLSFGVIEEGPTIAALFFFAMFFLSKTPITTHEMVIVATMGSAGGSLGFITNFYAARAMVGAPLSMGEAAGFAVVTSLLGMLFVIPLRDLLILKEQLPWPGSKATHSVISALVEEGDPKQPRYLAATILVAMALVILNDEDGFGLLPGATELPIFGLAAYGLAIAWSPFAIGGAYLMGLRTCVGFLTAAVVLLAMAPYTPTPASPNKYIWPGVGFLVATGLTQMALNWRVVAESLWSLRNIGASTDDDDPPLGRGALIALAVVALGTTMAYSVGVMGLNLLLTLALVVVGGLLQNVIATRAAAQTAFNPARVMGVLLQGVSALAGGAAAPANLVGAGFVAGSGAQAGNLSGDLVYGRWFGVPSRHQFWLQMITIVPCAFVSAWVFTQIQARHALTLESELPAPVAKMWAASALVFDGTTPMPPGAGAAMVVGAIAGAIYVVLESRPAIARYLPASVGIGIGMVLPVAADLAFFAGGFVLWVVCGRWLGVRDITLTTVAVGCIVAEGFGGVAKPLLAMAGVLGHP